MSETMPEGLSLVANTLPPTCPASLGSSRPKSGRDLAEPQDVCLECLCFRVLASMGEVLTEWVAGGVPPLESFNGIGAKLVILTSENLLATPWGFLKLNVFSKLRLQCARIEFGDPQASFWKVWG